MLESFVDLSYRGLALGRRIKLTYVRPSTGYLEHPTPMPVGTPVALTTDDGLVIDAIVTDVHEQVGGATDKPPGMTVRPALADDARASWWKARVTLPEFEPLKRTERAKPLTVRPRSQTVPQPFTTDGVAVAAPEESTMPVPVVASEPDEKRTVVMDAVDQEILEQLSRTTTEVDTRVRSTGEHPVVDDGKLTMVMDAVDPAVLEAAMSGGDDEEDEEDSGVHPVAGNGNGNGDKKTQKKRRKKRR